MWRQNWELKMHTKGPPFLPLPLSQSCFLSILSAVTSGGNVKKCDSALMNWGFCSLVPVVHLRRGSATFFIVINQSVHFHCGSGCTEIHCQPRPKEFLSMHWGSKTLHQPDREMVNLTALKKTKHVVWSFSPHVGGILWRWSCIHITISVCMLIGVINRIIIGFIFRLPADTRPVFICLHTSDRWNVSFSRRGTLTVRPSISTSAGTPLAISVQLGRDNAKLIWLWAKHIELYILYFCHNLDVGALTALWVWLYFELLRKGKGGEEFHK